jgi:hypothetical protein
MSHDQHGHNYVVAMTAPVGISDPACLRVRFGLGHFGALHQPRRHMLECDGMECDVMGMGWEWDD